LFKFEQIAIGTENGTLTSPPMAEALATLAPWTEKTAVAWAAMMEASHAHAHVKLAEIWHLTGAADGHRCSTTQALNR
jgi:hypothetical protein